MRVLGGWGWRNLGEFKFLVRLLCFLCCEESWEIEDFSEGRIFVLDNNSCWYE